MKEPWEVYGIINGMEGFQLSVVGGRLRPLLLVLAHGLQSRTLVGSASRRPKARCGLLG